MKNEKVWKIIIFIFLLIWIGFLLARKIDLSTADLGRHLKNGEWMVNSGFNFSERNSPLYENYYSYTYPSFPAINHHWGSGVIFYYIWKLFGFSGLSLSFIFLNLVAFGLFFLIATKESGFSLAALFSFFLAPLMAERVEIRPEVFNVFFGAVYFFVLWMYLREKISWKWLLSLIPLQIIWVNLHVYFFLGLFLIGVFLVSEIGGIIFSRLTDLDFRGKMRKIKALFAILVLSTLGTLLNPAGLKGTLHPFEIYKNYGYTVLEEKSVWFLENYGIMNPNFFLIKSVLILMIIAFILLLIINRRKISVYYLLLAAFFGAIGWMALRNFTLLGFFALPILGYGFGSTFKQKGGEMNLVKENGVAILYIIVILLGLYGNYQYVSAHARDSGIGLRLDVEKAADFIKEEKITGPIFNNYDIGGYLIFNLPAGEKVFVDNRPEVYPNSFFSEVYKPMQDNPAIFEKIDSEYNFNAVIFYPHDITPWGQSFLENITNNESWVPVYKDEYAIILLKKNEANQSIIERYQIPNTKY